MLSEWSVAYQINAKKRVSSKFSLLCGVKKKNGQKLEKNNQTSAANIFTGLANYISTNF